MEKPLSKDPKWMRDFIGALRYEAMKEEIEEERYLQAESSVVARKIKELEKENLDLMEIIKHQECEIDLLKNGKAQNRQTIPNWLISLGLYGKVHVPSENYYQQATLTGFIEWLKSRKEDR